MSKSVSSLIMSRARYESGCRPTITNPGFIWVVDLHQSHQGALITERVWAKCGQNALCQSLRVEL